MKFAWTKGAVRKELDIKLPRGVLVRGKVTEAGTNRPLAGSSIQFIPVRARGGRGVLSGSQAIVASHGDGSFDIAVPPGKGHLLVFGPTGDYLLDSIGSNRIFNDRPGGLRYYAHAILPYEAEAGEPPREVAAALRPGATIKGRVEGPDGQAVADAVIISALYPGSKVRDGRFELHGVAPEGSARIAILDPAHEWGATAEVSGKPTGEEPTIRLQPCGKAKARFVGPDGKPVARHQPIFEFVATPGPSQFSLDEKDRAELLADADYVANIDGEHYGRPPSADAEGRIVLPDLVPGATYRDHRLLGGERPKRGQGGRQGVHRQARRDARPGRYRDPEAIAGVTHPRLSQRVRIFSGFSRIIWDCMKISRAAQARGDETTPGASGASDDPVDRHDLCTGGSCGMTSTSLVRQLGALFEGGSAAGLSDRQLIERFVAGHDQAGEAAFAALVARHGPMVLGVCRQLLGDHQHAEDAFQAVFLVLARKARSLREPELLGNWLYGVALRTARARPGEGSPAGTGPRSKAPRDIRPCPPPRPPIGSYSTASRPRCFTARSTDCPGPSGCRWCSATSRACPTTRRRTG